MAVELPAAVDDTGAADAAAVAAAAVDDAAAAADGIEVADIAADAVASAVVQNSARRMRFENATVATVVCQSIH